MKLDSLQELFDEDLADVDSAEKQIPISSPEVVKPRSRA